MSFVKTMNTDVGTVVNPTWDDVEKAIVDLNAKDMTLIMLAPARPKGPPDGESQMGIGGGKDNRCVVFMTDDNLSFWNLEDPAGRADKRVLMLVGGQEGDYREAQCVPRAWALEAAREYFKSGGRADGLPWTAG